jgi:UDP-GlcNAc:undecaprenyl-phosphate GlcNAc-1-phosphate transferase
MGFSQKQAVAIAYAISGVLGMAAVVIATRGEIRAIILVAAFFVAGAIGFFVMKGFGKESQQNEPPAEKDENPPDNPDNDEAVEDITAADDDPGEQDEPGGGGAESEPPEDRHEP